ncbi:hypothetical protein JT359_06470 [Candidatus Poribacteria bacterium]|nr:hypothetical protein [Candidatus Poribacteria bacterium]
MNHLNKKNDDGRGKNKNNRVIEKKATNIKYSSQRFEIKKGRLVMIPLNGITKENAEIIPIRIGNTIFEIKMN